MHSLGAAFVAQLSDVLVASSAFLVRLSPVLQWVEAVFVSNFVNVSVLLLFVIVTLIINWLL
jgi:hypothetical protein